MTTNIQVSDEIRSWLVSLKYRLKCKDYDEVLMKIKKLIQTLRIQKDLEDLK